MIPKPVNITTCEDFTLQVKFDNGEERIFDVTPYIEGSWFGHLSELSYFKTARVANNTVEWPEGQDIAPHELYELSTPTA